MPRSESHQARVAKYGRRGLPISFHAAALVDEIAKRVDDKSVNARAKQDLADYYRVIEETLGLNPVTLNGARAILKAYTEEGTSKRITGPLVFAYDDACRRFLHGGQSTQDRSSFIAAGFRLR